jgi:hypothetical protein
MERIKGNSMNQKIKPLTVQQMYDLLEVADPTETLQDDPHGTWEIVEFVRQIEKYYGIERPDGLYQEWKEWKIK